MGQANGLISTISNDLDDLSSIPGNHMVVEEKWLWKVDPATMDYDLYWKPNFREIEKSWFLEENLQPQIY